MEVIPNGEAKIGSGDKAKKRSWGSMFYKFLSSGGIIVLIVVGFVLTVVISVLVK